MRIVNEWKFNKKDEFVINLFAIDYSCKNRYNQLVVTIIGFAFCFGTQYYPYNETKPL